MLIHQLEFEDFLTFPGKQSLSFDFVEERNITVVLAPNNTGKTSTIRALYFLLYGATNTEASKFPCHATVCRMRPGEEGTASIRAQLERGATRYQVERTIFFRRVGDTTEDGGQILTVEVYSQDCDLIQMHQIGEKFVRKSQLPEELLENFVSRDLFDFYFFKGEELTDRLLKPEAGKSISNGFKSFLYQKEWDALEGTFRRVRVKFEKAVQKIAKNATKYRDLSSQRDHLEQLLANLKGQQEASGEALPGLRSRKDELSARLAELVGEANPNAKIELERREAGLRREEARLRNLEERRDKVLGRESAQVLTGNVLEEVHAILDKMKDQRGLPKDVSAGLLDQLIADEKCICERECAAGTDEHAALVQLRNRSINDGATEELWKLWNRTKPGAGDTSFYKGISVCRHELESLETERDSCVLHIEALQEEVTDLRSRVNEDKLALQAEIKRELSATEQEIEKIGREDRMNQQLLKQKTHDVQVVRDDLRRLDVGDEKVISLQRRVDLADEMLSLAKNCREGMRAEIYRSLSDNVTRMYAEIVNDGSQALVAGDTLLPRIERNGVRLETGGGQEQVLLLTYLIALAEARENINHEMRTRFAVREVYRQGFFMDSIFGKTQKDYRKEVGKLLPKHMPQLVIFFADQQWSSDVAAGLRESVTNVYGMTLSTPNRNIDESQYHYEGFGVCEEVRLLEKLEWQEGEAKPQAYATIRSLSQGVEA